MEQVSIQKKHISLNNEYSQITQEKTSLMARLPKSDRAQLSQQVLSPPDTKHETSKKASCSLTCFLMNPISTDRKEVTHSSSLTWEGDTAAEAIVRDTVPQFALPPLRWIEGQPWPLCSQTTISAVHHASKTVPQKKATGRTKEWSSPLFPDARGLVPLAGGGSLVGAMAGSKEAAGQRIHRAGRCSWQGNTVTCKNLVRSTN